MPDTPLKTDKAASIAARLAAGQDPITGLYYELGGSDPATRKARQKAQVEEDMRREQALKKNNSAAKKQGAIAARNSGMAPTRD